MLEEIKTVIRAAMAAFGKRIAPIEADVEAIKADLVELKAFRDELKGAGLGDLQAEIEELAGKANDETKPVEPAPTADRTIPTTIG